MSLPSIIRRTEQSSLTMSLGFQNPVDLPTAADSVVIPAQAHFLSVKGLAAALDCKLGETTD
jgi:hypothetical protein